jgi:hypothetical protein
MSAPTTGHFVPERVLIPEAPAKTGNRTKAKIAALVSALAFTVAGVGTFLAVGGSEDAAPAASPEAASVTGSAAIPEDFNWGLVDRGGMPIGRTTTLVEPGREFTTALDGSALTCTFGPIVKADPTSAAPGTRNNVRMSIVDGKCAPDNQAPVYVNVDGTLTKVGFVDGGPSNLGLSFVRIDETAAGGNIGIDTSIPGIIAPAAFEKLAAGDRVNVRAAAPCDENAQDARWAGNFCAAKALVNPTISGVITATKWDKDNARLFVQTDTPITGRTLGAAVYLPDRNDMLIVGVVSGIQDDRHFEITPLDKVVFKGNVVLAGS